MSHTKEDERLVYSSEGIEYCYTLDGSHVSEIVSPDVASRLRSKWVTETAFGYGGKKAVWRMYAA